MKQPVNNYDKSIKFLTLTFYSSVKLKCMDSFQQSFNQLLKSGIFCKTSEITPPHDMFLKQTYGQAINSSLRMDWIKKEE